MVWVLRDSEGELAGTEPGIGGGIAGRLRLVWKGGEAEAWRGRVWGIKGLSEGLIGVRMKSLGRRMWPSTSSVRSKYGKAATFFPTHSDSSAEEKKVEK